MSGDEFTNEETIPKAIERAEKVAALAVSEGWNVPNAIVVEPLEMAADIISDQLHLAESRGVSSTDVLRLGLRNYQAEQEETAS